ncbi:carbohydrate binding domain-containing protein [Cohnella sp.]|uniref:carbohydrate binding domain-containing protein n=1 Tax=Cohnella sp. TaxID=1883426 RepID=UPI00356AA13E
MKSKQALKRFLITVSLLTVFLFSNVSSAAQYVYTYDNNNRLEKVVVTDNQGTYEIVYSHDDNGNRLSTSKNIIMDLKPPTTPQNLMSPTQSTTTIDLTWSPSTDSQSISYKINLNGVYFAATTNTYFTVQNLSPHTSYSFTVKAIDASSNESPDSTPLAVSTLSSIPTTPNLVVNAGFETGNLTPWTIWNNATNWSVISTGAYSGQHALRIGTQVGGQQDFFSGFEPNQTYELSGWGRVGTSGQAANLEIKGNAGLKQIIQFTSTVYEYKSIQFTTPADASWVAVLFWNGGSSDFYLDDARVLKVNL